MFNGAIRICVAFCILFCAEMAQAGTSVRVEIESGVSATLSSGRQLFLECQPPKGDAAAFWSQYLADPSSWTIYKDRMAVALSYERVNLPTRRAMLLALFPNDNVDGRGWWHVVTYSGQNGQESIWSLCEWLTGKGTTYRQIMADKQNKSQGTALARGQRILIPASLLLDVMKTPTPQKRNEGANPVQDTGRAQKVSLPGETGNNGGKPIDLEAAARDLEYGSDAQGAYAAYQLKSGEALYTAVVVRFTDYRDNTAIQDACNTIQRRSGITDLQNMPAGQRILIPVEMLSDRFAPKGSENRKEYEETLAEANRLRQDKFRTRDLQGVVVVLDPGHGGRDPGAENKRLGLHEDAINYDIACRAKNLLETKTRARVYMTMKDFSRGYEPFPGKKLPSGKNRKVLTTPNYLNEDPVISSNLRWYLANAIYRDALKKGTDPRKVVFTSFHTEAFFNSTLRGAMIYIPGANYRRESEEKADPIYKKFKEFRDQPVARSTVVERRRDEALSRNLAEDFMATLGRKNIRRHLESDWIRSQIRQDGGKVYVPAVLRNTLIPTKILVEMANITNETDCARIMDPKWRQAFAEAYVDALRSYYGS